MWLVDGALVNSVPVSVCRAYEQPLVVAVNLHYDLFGRAAVDQAQRRRAGGRERRPFARQPGSCLGISGVMVEAFNIILGPHLARPARRRPAGPVSAAEAWAYRPVGIPSRRRIDPHRLRDDQGIFIVMLLVMWGIYLFFLFIFLFFLSGSANSSGCRACSSRRGVLALRARYQPRLHF